MSFPDHPRAPRLRRAFVGLSVLAVIASGAAGGSGTGTLRGAGSGTMLYSPALATGARSSGVTTGGSVPAPTFFPNVRLPCTTDVAGTFGCGQLLEPEVISGPDGTIYVTAQEGLPGGVDVWRRDPGTFEYKHLGKADANEPLTSATGFALGGGDNDVAVTTDGRLLVASLSLVSAPVSYSTDRGETFTKIELANGLPNVDRMWMTTVGKSTVYYAYHDNEISQIWLVKSTDGGETWGAPVPVLPPTMLPQWLGVQATVGNVQGDMVADPDGRVVIPFLSPTDLVANVTPRNKPNGFYVAVTDTDGSNPQVHAVFEGQTDLMGLFPAIASDAAGNLYAAWTDKHGVFLSISRDHGVNWSAPRKISTGPGNASTVFPFVIAGSEGRVALAWLGTAATSNDDKTARWIVYYAMSTDALAKDPSWTQVVASDHVVHVAAVCLDGLTCSATGGDRRLAEVLQMGLTKDGRVIVAYPDSSSVSIGAWSYLAEQRFGPGLYADKTPTPPLLVPAARKGGPISALNKRETARFYLTGGEGVPGLPGPEGEIDTVFSSGQISTTPGQAGHISASNGLTNTFIGLPMTFDGAAVPKTQILGGTLTFEAFIRETTSDVARAAGNPGAITIRLLDVGPNDTAREISTHAAYYEAGPEPTKNTFEFAMPTRWEMLKGHRLRVEISFAVGHTSVAELFYGDQVHPSGFTIETFAAGAVAPARPVPRPPLPKPLPGALPGTGVASSYLLALLALGAAGFTARSLLKRRG